MQFPIDDIALQAAAMPKGLLDIISNALSAGLLIYDAQDNILFASSSISQLLDISPSLLAEGTPLRDLFSAYYDSRKMADPDFALQKHSIDKSAWIADNLAAHWKERCESEDRLPKKRWLRSSRRRMAGGLGICVISDISEQKRSENQWRSDIERVQVIEEMLDRLSFPITVTDQNHIYVGANKAACQFVQKPIESIVGRSISELHVPLLSQRIARDNQAVLDNGQPLNVPERIALPSGEEQLFVTYKVRVGKPGMYYVLSCMQDITSFASVGADGALCVTGLETMDFIQSPVNAGLRQEDVAGDMPRVLLVCSDEATAKHAKQRLTLCGMEADYVTSKEQVLAVLTYCKRSELWLDLVLICEDFDVSMVAEVAAIGLRVERVSNREVESALTEIVCTTLNVRCAQCRKGVEPSRKLKDCTLCDVLEQPSSQLDVLVAEDNQINQVVLAQIFDSLKLKYRIVATGQELLASALSHSANIVFIDTTLPDMDGYRAASLLRSLLAQAKSAPVPIIGIVALAFEGDREKCLASGMDDMVLKPLSPDIIDSIIKRHRPSFSNSSKINISQH